MSKGGKQWSAGFFSLFSHLLTISQISCQIHTCGIEYFSYQGNFFQTFNNQSSWQWASSTLQQFPMASLWCAKGFPRRQGRLPTLLRRTTVLEDSLKWEQVCDAVTHTTLFAILCVCMLLEYHICRRKIGYDVILVIVCLVWYGDVKNGENVWFVFQIHILDWVQIMEKEPWLGYGNDLIVEANPYFGLGPNYGCHVGRLFVFDSNP